MVHSEDVSVSPNSADKSVLADATEAMRGGDLDRAELLCARILQDKPSCPRALRLKGRILERRGKTAAAIEAYELARSEDPTDVMSHWRCAVAYLRQQLPEPALGALARVKELRPGMRQAFLLELRILARDHRAAAVAKTAEEALQHFPDDHEFSTWRSAALRLLGQVAQALALVDSVLDKHPDYQPALLEQGVSLLQLGRHAEALDPFDKVLELDQDNLDALIGIGVAELHSSMYDAAVAAFKQAITIAPENVDAHLNVGLAEQARGRSDLARSAFARALTLDPGNVDVLNNTGLLALQARRFDEARRLLTRAAGLAPDRPDIYSNLLSSMLYLPEVTRDDLVAAHHEWGKRFRRKPERYTSWENDRDPERPLRIGFISAELGAHPIGSVALPLLCALNNDGFFVNCYSMRKQEDNSSIRLKNLIQRWQKVIGIDDSSLAEQVRHDGIDILIDLSGHYAHNRLTCFALKPAPVQATFLGYPFTTGLDAIDYMITDSEAVSTGEEASYVETVLRLPICRFAFAPPVPSPPVVAPPAITKNSVTFGSFSNTSKLSADVIRVWSQILLRQNQSTLVLKWPAYDDSAVAAHLREAFRSHGVDSTRVELRSGSGKTEMLRQYGDIDIALDPFPFGGGATTFDALWMGVPVITLPSSHPASRQSQSMLGAIGRHEWVAECEPGYIDIADTLATSHATLEAMRYDQRQRIAASSICDVDLLASEFGSALRTMWRRYVATSHRSPLRARSKSC